MAKKKKYRPFTAAEAAEVYDLCFQGRLGRLSAGDRIGRCGDLFGINPDEYREIHDRAVAKANASVNPLAKQAEAEEPEA